MDADVQSVARHIAELIPQEKDTGGWRWMVFQMADEIGLCHERLTANGLPLPDPAQRPSSSMDVEELLKGARHG